MRAFNAGKIAKQRKLGLLLVAALSVLGVLVQESQAYQWIRDEPQAPRDIVWKLNREECPQEVLGTLLAVSELLSFYLPQEVRYGGSTTRKEAVDGQYTVRCMPILSMMDRGYSFMTAGVALVTSNDVDIIFNADLFSWDVALHEMLHMLGLDHSEVDSSAVCTGLQCRSRGRLDRDDLEGLAALYGAVPNCTPYVSESLRIYLPQVADHWAEVMPVDPNNLSLGFYISDSGPAEGEWACDLDYTPDSLAASVFYQGEVLEVELRRDGALWFLEGS